MVNNKIFSDTTVVRRLRGFTLIELLVVVAILALLIAILIPSLGKAREKAKQVACGTNLHGFGIAIQTYISEYSKALTSNHYANTGIPNGIWVYNNWNDNQGNPTGDQISLEAMAPYMKGVNGLNPASHDLSAITITKVWVCPSQPFFPTNSDVSGYHWFSINYSYFAGFDSTLRGLATTPDDLFGHTPQPNKILMEDSFFRWQGGGGKWDINHGLNGTTGQHNSGPYLTGPPKFSGNNVLTSDYSVRFKQANEYVSPAQLDAAPPSAQPHVIGGGGDQTFY